MAWPICATILVNIPYRGICLNSGRTHNLPLAAILGVTE